MIKSILSLTAAISIAITSVAQQYTNKIFIGLSDQQLQQYDKNEFLKTVAQQFSVTIEPSFSFTPEQYAEMSKNAIKNAGSDASIQKLKNLYTIVVPNSNAVQQVFQSLENNYKFEYVEQEVYMPSPPADIPPTTSFFNRQLGFMRADSGINIEYAWSKGIFGQNVNVFDVEYGVNLNHEKLEDMNVKIHDSMTISTSVTEDFSEHGTATIGVVCGDKFEYGTIGMMHGITSMTLVPEYTNERGYNRLLAVQRAIASARPGDIIMYEMQTGVQNTEDYVPADFSTPIWNVTKAAVDEGKIIIAAAGNGGVDLDFDTRLDAYRAKGDNGSIIVGAGSSDMQHNILSFSTFGERVNVQGWGRNVGAPGYGDFRKVGNDFNQNYTLFSGTSSATPIVSSAAIAVQSYYYSKTNNYLNCRQIRDILIQTGTPQGDPNRGHIGPLPNVQKAFDMVDSIAGATQIENISKTTASINLYPNPANDVLHLDVASIPNIKHIYIFNVNGQMIYVSSKAQNSIDISQLKSGNYQLLVLDNNYKTYHNTFIKQ